MKKILMTSIVAIMPLPLLLNYSNNISVNSRPLTVLEKQLAVFEKVGVELKKFGLPVTPKEYAKMAVVVAYCESNLETTTNAKDGSQGLFQFTASTRRILETGDISDDTFGEQVSYHFKYLICTGKISQIKSVVDLHQLNFAPSSSLKKRVICKSSEYLSGLDVDKDALITRDDLSLFENNRTKNNKEIHNIYLSIKKNYARAIFNSDLKTIFN
jgi:hypothetical protein